MKLNFECSFFVVEENQPYEETFLKNWLVTHHSMANWFKTVEQLLTVGF